MSCLLIVKMALFVNMSNVLKCRTIYSIYSMILSVDIRVLEMIVSRFDMHEEDITDAKSHVFALVVKLVDH